MASKCLLSLFVRICRLVALPFLLTCSAIGICDDTAEDPIAYLRPGHPRLLLNDQDLAAAVTAAKSDPLRAALHACIIATAEQVLTAPPARHIPPGNGSLDQVRYAVRYILTCAFAYRLTGDQRFLNRAKSDMFVLANFPDWNPSHFLDVGESSFAVAIGYDWLYPHLKPEERAILKQALIEKSLRLAEIAYSPDGRTNRFAGWAYADGNWNQVCNSGVLSAALAIADEEPDLARRIIAGFRASTPHGMSAYAPDGEYPEGPGYWTYATTYAVIAFAELKGALGTDFDLPAAPGFDHTLNYYQAVQGPFGRMFNYADATDDLQNSPARAWLADRYHLATAMRDTRALLAESLQLEKGPVPFDPTIQRQVVNRFFPLHAIWFPKETTEKDTDLPLDLHFRGFADIALFRSAWDDPRAIFAGFKAGDNSPRHHNHLDLGSFVLDADGQRWAMDLGPDKYELPGYFNVTNKEQRWSYFRANNHSHNTVTPGDALQSRNIVAPIIAFGTTPARGFVVADLTPAYPDKATSLRRGIALLDRARVLVQDEYQPTKPATPLHWVMVTPAKIDVAKDGRSAMLISHDRSLRADLLEPATARLTVGSTKPPTPDENQNDGTSMLAIDVTPGSVSNVTRVAVLLTPLGEKWPRLAAPKLSPLADWR